jgi:hypothetical protein
MLQVEKLKMTSAFVTIANVKLEYETFFSNTIFKIGYLQMEHDALQKQLKIKQSMLEEKIK